MNKNLKTQNNNKLKMDAILLRLLDRFFHNFFLTLFSEKNFSSFPKNYEVLNILIMKWIFLKWKNLVMNLRNSFIC